MLRRVSDWFTVEGDERIRRLSTAAGTILILLLAGSYTPASASRISPESDGGPSSLRITDASGPAGTQHIVTCSFYATEPLRFPSEDKLQASANVQGCIPNDPDTCRIESDIELYDRSEKRWYSYASGPVRYGPPCQGLKSPAVTYNCESSTGDINTGLAHI